MSNDETFVYYEDGLIDSSQMIKKLLKYKEKEHDTSNLTAPWPNVLIPEGVGEVKIWVINDTSVRSYLLDRIRKLFPNIVLLSNYYFDFHVTEWGKDSFVPWHDDHSYSIALTCYLEDNTEYGGEFMCKPFPDQSIGMFLEPKVNRACIIKGVEHCVTKIHDGTRTTLQVWGKKIDANI